MAETQRVAAVADRTDEVLSYERGQVDADGLAEAVAQERRYALASELLALHGGRLEHHALAGCKPVETRGDQRLDAGRDGDCAPIGRP